MKTKMYLNGDGHSKWGIYNTLKKGFQFGICENTPKLAYDKSFQKIGNNARKWRFEVRKLKQECLNGK